MSIRAGFFNSNVDANGNYDRAEQADFFAKYFSEFISNGIYANPSDNFQILATTGMNLTVKAGPCYINGYFGWQQTDDSLALDAAPLANPRIDRIVLRLQLADEQRNITIEVLKGTEAANPVAPAITRTDNTWDLVLADVYIGANVSAITQADINDRRLDTNLCGIVHAVVDHIDTATLYTQIQGDMANFKDITQADFTNWIQSIKEILDEETAGNLLLQIQQLQDVTTVMQADPNNYVVSHTDMVNGGNDYADSDEITVNGITPISITVSGGVIASIVLEPTIKHSADPAGTFDIVGGSGTGASANIVTRHADGDQIVEGSLQHVPPQDPLVQASRVRRYLSDWTKSGWLSLAPLATIYNYNATNKTAKVDITGADYRSMISAGMKGSYLTLDGLLKYFYVQSLSYNKLSNTTTITVLLESSNTITGSISATSLMYSYAETPYLFPKGFSPNNFYYTKKLDSKIIITPSLWTNVLVGTEQNVEAGIYLMTASVSFQCSTDTYCSASIKLSDDPSVITPIPGDNFLANAALNTGSNQVKTLSLSGIAQAPNNFIIKPRILFYSVQQMIFEAITSMCVAKIG